jgi:hypothetical protein
MRAQVCMEELPVTLEVLLSLPPLPGAAAASARPLAKAISPEGLKIASGEPSKLTVESGGWLSEPQRVGSAATWVGT